jgi:hypothetical protein
MILKKMKMKKVIKRAVWWMRGHLEWKYGFEWELYAREECGLHNVIPMEMTLVKISAYDYWKKYSPLNGS